MISQKTKDKETDPKCKLDYRGNLDEAVTEKIKLSDSKKKRKLADTFEKRKNQRYI